MDKVYREYEQMRSSLRKADRTCWSEMFNEVYHLTEEYCAGCNAHSNIINEETVYCKAFQHCRNHAIKELLL